MWRYLLAVILVLHGLVHAIGFAAAWQFGGIAGVSATPSVPTLEEASATALALGALWLVAGAGFVVGGIALATARAAWVPITAAAGILSLALTAMWWQSAPVGIAIDVAVLGFLVLVATRRTGDGLGLRGG